MNPYFGQYGYWFKNMQLWFVPNNPWLLFVRLLLSFFLSFFSFHPSIILSFPRSFSCLSLDASQHRDRQSPEPVLSSMERRLPTHSPSRFESTEAIGHLKDLIKAKKAYNFHDVDVYGLILWRVPIPVVPANKHKPIVLNKLESATELDPTDDVFDVFQEMPPKKQFQFTSSSSGHLKVMQTRFVLIFTFAHEPIYSFSNFISNI